MQFIDEAKIYIESGKGGDGCVSFRREKFIARGGPNGGDGGKGGDVIIRSTRHLNTLIDFRYQQKFKASNGGNGMGKNRFGAGGKDLIIEVPIGTEITDESGDNVLCDIIDNEQEITLAKGGKGGLGNYHFRSSVNRSPQKATKGEEAIGFFIKLKLKLISDIGLVGLPNAGKSSFISAVTKAKPKIADYPFTTLNPNLGVLSIDEKEIIVADIPGLIEGAHKGVGLGDKFLKHIERCKSILHLIDINEDDLFHRYQIIRNELEKYSSELMNKKEIIALNKIDLLEEDEIIKKVNDFSKKLKKDFFKISILKKSNIKELLRALK